MPVLKTISPNTSPVAPKPVPWKTVPSSRTRTAGEGPAAAWVAATAASSGKLAVEDRGTAPKERGDHPAGQHHARERGVAAPGRLRGRVDRLPAVRVIERQVRARPRRERLPVPGQPPDRGRPCRHPVGHLGPAERPGPPP